MVAGSRASEAQVSLRVESYATDGRKRQSQFILGWGGGIGCQALTRRRHCNSDRISDSP